MSIESLPSAPRDDEPQVDQETIDEINSITPAERPELSGTGSRLVRAATRINGFLEKRAVNKAHGEALAENAQRDRDAQDAAFSTYEDNVSTTAERENLENDWAAAQDAHYNGQRDEAYAMNDEMDKNARREARAEKIASAKEMARSWGAAALETTKKSWAATKSGAETAALYAMITTDKVKDAAQKAQVRTAERAAYREDFARKAYDQEAAFASYEDNVAFSQDHEEALAMNEQKKAAQEAAYASYEDNVTFSQDHEEALAMNEQKKADQEAAYASYESNIDTTALREDWEKAQADHLNEQHAEALDMNAEFDANKAREAAIAKARAARMRQLQRKALRAQLQKQSGEVITAAGQKAKGLTKKFGRSIARFARRSAKVVAGAAQGAVQGARAGYQE